MNGLALGDAAAGLAVVSAAGVPVTELAVWLSGGLPAGGAVGAAAAALVALGVVGDAAPGGRRTVFTLAVFGLVFLLVLAVELVLLSRRLSISLPVAVLVAVGFALYAFVRATSAE